VHSQEARNGYRLVEDHKNMVTGCSADMVVNALGNPDSTVVIGKDADGLIVEWYYPDAIFTLAYAVFPSVSAYTVCKIEVKDANPG